jgi:hypothetical protein
MRRTEALALGTERYHTLPGWRSSPGSGAAPPALTVVRSARRSEQQRRAGAHG